MNPNFEFKDGNPTLISGEDYFKINQYNEVNLRYLIGDLKDEPLYGFPKVNLGSFTIEIGPYIEKYTLIQSNVGKYYLTNSPIYQIKDNPNYLCNCLIMKESTKGLRYLKCKKPIPIFDKNGKLIVKVLAEI